MITGDYGETAIKPFGLRDIKGLRGIAGRVISRMLRLAAFCSIVDILTVIKPWHVVQRRLRRWVLWVGVGYGVWREREGGGRSRSGTPVGRYHHMVSVNTRVFLGILKVLTMVAGLIKSVDRI